MRYGQGDVFGFDKGRVQNQRRAEIARMSTSRYDQIMKTFGKRLKRAREQAGYRSAQSFAAALGIEPHGYRKYERGQSEPNFETLVRICELLDTDPGALLPVQRRRLGPLGSGPGPGSGQAQAA